MYCYAELDNHGLVIALLQCSIPVPSSDEFFEIPSYDLGFIGRYVINGVLGPVPAAGMHWVWSDSANSFELEAYD